MEAERFLLLELPSQLRSIMDMALRISIGEQLHSSGAVAVAVLGLILANHKTAISSDAASFIEK